MIILQRTFRHWTPAYVLSRTAEFIYGRRHANMPWLTPTANSILPTLLRSSDIGLEWGSGRSTVWFAGHVAHLTSVEHHDGWYRRVREQLAQRNLVNVEYVHVPARNEVEPAQPADAEPYVRIADHFSDDSLDFALVDGVYRSACAMAVIPKLRSGGLLILDNANWFLPTGSAAPSTRGIHEGPASAQWTAFHQALSGWRCIWTTSGVTDTMIWIKPCT
jgi:predicted O-methyltransferase YrrM